MNGNTTTTRTLNPQYQPSRNFINGSHRFHHTTPSRSSRLPTPNSVMTDDPTSGPVHPSADDDPRITEFKNRFNQTASRLDQLFARQTSSQVNGDQQLQLCVAQEPGLNAGPVAVPKSSTRTIDDDYGDDDEDDEEEAESPLKAKSVFVAPAVASIPTPPTSSLSRKPPSLLPQSSSISASQGKTLEDVRKRLQEERQAAEEEAKEQFNTLFYTLDNDKRAMLEQQKLDELDRQVENEISGETGAAGQTNAVATQQGSLSSANLGATSLMLKHLLARIDSKRHLVHAQDSQLRRLISEVRKNRSKWSSEDKIGQEELYEAAERVLQELKAMTENSSPFLQKVNKREAPDYYNIIKHPMDIGTMQKKLKNLHYKSKQDFVADLYLIWSNCLKYNSSGDHPLRKKALIMQKQTDRLVILIPDIVIRDRAEVEAEERRQAQAFEQDADGQDDSEDDLPIKASRGRKAPGKGSKKGASNARKAPPAAKEATPGLDTKPLLNGLRQGSVREDSNAPTELNGFQTPPPPGSANANVNGPKDSQNNEAADGDHSTINGDLAAEAEDPELDDFEYRLWKQTTKKARAEIASERNRLFRSDRINGEEPALLRSKASMRRFMRQQKQLLQQQHTDVSAAKTEEASKIRLPGESLANSMEEEGDSAYVPESYDPVSGVPDIDSKLAWEEDEDGTVVPRADECLRLMPEGLFRAPESKLSRKMDANMRQMQETRKVCAKIGIVKQMQIQTQMYQNQFNKYEPEPFLEADIEPHVTSEEDPIMAPWVCRAALQRSISKICYHTGFEDAQPSALDAITDVTVFFLNRLVGSIKGYAEAPKLPVIDPASAEKPTYQPRYTFEETILHSLEHNGVDLPALESYAKEDFDRAGTKLTVMHDRMRSHLAELLRPALDPNTTGADGVGAFNDGSEQFVGGDFAEDIGDDFFGFKELGLDRELGLESLTVPFHLLQNRLHSAHQGQHANNSILPGETLPEPDKFVPVSLDTIKSEIGLIQDFFLTKLHNSAATSLLEDDELPLKQRFPKPRLPPNGKITSPRKRPLREQQQAAKKKRKLEASQAMNGTEVNGIDVNGVHANEKSSTGVGGPVRPILKPTGKLKLDMGPPSNSIFGDPEKEEDVPGMMSPESM